MDFTRLIVRLLVESGHFSKARHVQRTGTVEHGDVALMNGLLIAHRFAHAVDAYPLTDDEDGEAAWTDAA